MTGSALLQNAKLVELIKTRFLGVHPDELDCYLEYDDWTRIIAALSVPLPEVEGGDKGDAGMECQYSKDVGMPEHRCAVRCQYALGGSTDAD